MELRSLLPTLSTSLPPTSFTKNGFSFPRFCIPIKYQSSRKLLNFHITAQLPPAGAVSFSSATVEATSQNVCSKDEDTVFVAGATGRVGSRTVRELLKLGFRVKAGVRSAQRAESLVQSVRQMKLDTEATSGVQAIEKLEIVECDLEKSDQIVPALGRASLVICCIGASEKEIFDVTGPYRIDYLATKNLIDAATVAKVDHFILLTSLGTNKVGFPAAILNLFWGVLLWKRKAEVVLIDSGLPYTIVRPGGMERPTDSFKETHNLALFPEDTLFGGLVSNLQVAELMAFMAQNRELSHCKIVEAIAETTAPLTPMGELLAKIPSKRTYVYKAKKEEVANKAELTPAPKITVTEEAKDKEPSTKKSTVLEPKPAENSTSEVPISLTGENTVEEENTSVIPRPLSPYTAYVDLKPPSSPCPTPPMPEEKKKEIADMAPEMLQKKQPLSPYASYEDLKPPTSPSPSTPTKFVEEPSETLKTLDGTLINSVPQEPTFYQSPFPIYDDLKPPTSPTPTTPNSTPTPTPTLTPTNDESQIIIAMTSDEVTVETVKGDGEAGDHVENSTEPKPRPLSPYTMYADMKPPTSPTPSLQHK